MRPRPLFRITSLLWRLAPVAIAAACIGQAAQAQAPQQPGADVPPPPPPRLEPLPDSEQPAVTIQNPGSKGGTITEKRERGRVTQIQVEKGNSTYYLKPNVQPGSSLPGDAESSRNRAPQWRIGEFDLHRPPENQKPGEAPAGPAPVPPPPPLSK